MTDLDLEKIAQLNEGKAITVTLEELIRWKLLPENYGKRENKSTDGSSTPDY